MSGNHNQKDWPIWATEKVEIFAPDPTWIEKGKTEINHLYSLLSQIGVNEIEHVGSTSIPNLSAKPIIDLMVKVKTFDDLDRIVKILSDYNWHLVPPELDGKEWRRFFVKVKDDKRVVHLHLMQENEERWDTQLLFRDKLREQPNLAKKYGELKRKLAQENNDDREAYTEAKSDFVKSVLD